MGTFAKKISYIPGSIVNTTLYKTKMRELINILNESVGLANRKKGETFINPSGDLLTFNSLIFYPTDGKFDNADDMKQLVAEIEQRKQAEVEWVNKATSASLAFGVAEFALLISSVANLRVSSVLPAVTAALQQAMAGSWPRLQDAAA